MLQYRFYNQTDVSLDEELFLPTFQVMSSFFSPEKRKKIIDISLVDDQTIQTYNQKYRGKNKPTDILSFLYQGEEQETPTEEDIFFGEIILSQETINRQYQEYNNTFEEELITLCVHGVCHLFGYDHETEKDFFVMKKQEEFILNVIKNKKKDSIHE